MSVRTIEHRSKKQCSHSPSRKTKNPSYFPRHVVNKFEGEHLGMKVHPTTKSGLQDRKHKYAYIPSARVEDIIIKFIGLPYTDMCKEITRKFKECKTNFAFNLNKELANFFDVGRYGWRWYTPSYGVDKNGNVFKLKPLKNEGLHLSPSQIKWNKLQKIPNWGAVCKPRISKQEDYWSEKGAYRYNEGSPAVGSNIGEFYQPKLIGEYWCIVHKNIVKLPVYHVPQGKAYLNWATTKSSHEWDRNSKTYVKVERLPKYSDKFQRGLGKEEAEIFESQWAIPYIYMGKGTPYLFHSHKVKGINPEYQNMLECIEYTKKSLASDFAQTNSVYRIERERNLANYEVKLRATPETCMLEVGIGELYPLVRESDYQKYMGNSQSCRVSIIK